MKFARLLVAWLFAVAISLPFSVPAQAQQSGATAVASCGAATYTAGQIYPLQQTQTGSLCTNASGGSGSNAAAGPTGSAPPGSADYQGINVGGTLRGQTGVNPTGTVYAGQTDISSVGGTAVTTSVPVSTADGQVVTLGTLADPASCATSNSAIACLRQMDADIKGTGTIQGTAASGASVSGNPVLDGGRAATAAPTAVTDGQAVAKQLTPEGRTVTAPYAIKELMVRGTVISTDTAAHTIIASAGGSLKNYITAIQCGRTDAGATAIVLTFSDAASTVLILPSGGATNVSFQIPLATAAATAFTVTSGTGVSTLYCSAQGYTGL